LVESDRLHAFDHLKAIAIVAVVFTHAGSDAWFAQGSPLVWFVTKSWTVFHVPSFLFVSGFLYAKPRAIAASGAAARLLRVLLPYVLWSCVAQASGLSGAGSMKEVLLQFATASSLGVYYYVMLFSGCIVLMLPLSYLGRCGALVLWCVYTAYAAGAVVWPGWKTSDTLFWLMREPLQLYAFGFFLTGWLAALWRRELSAWVQGHPLAAIVGSSLLATLGLLFVSGAMPFSLGYFDRAVYTFGVISSCALLLSARPANRAERFLSDATLGIYLSHFLFILWLRPWVADWSEAPRVVALAAAGLVGGIGVCWLARRALGRARASRWLGA
jgi:surface polysaccharide O-acyltransferase-like enzyme